MEELNHTAVTAYLLKILSINSNGEDIEWLEEQKKRILEDTAGIKLFMAFSQASRYFRKDLNQLSDADLADADKLVSGFRPDRWNRLQTARTYLLLHFAAKDANHFLKSLERLLEAADMHEQEAIYAALPVFPYQEHLKLRAAEGLRTNITSVFDAIALNNPYPYRYLDEPAWNQMVLKSFFLQRPIYQIHGADERANAELAKILIDYAHERWAAGREVMPELWRFVGPFLTEDQLQDVQKVLQEGTALEKEAVLLACSQSGLPAAEKLVEAHGDVKAKITAGEITWETIGKTYLEKL
ncbi:MAG TPA: EboA domain-containing protein [Cyclobacteriaceae bacterium]|nr:EboA domain-containing protein [Cyclobacteriaceae bacterium]